MLTKPESVGKSQRSVTVYPEVLVLQSSIASRDSESPDGIVLHSMDNTCLVVSLLQVSRLRFLCSVFSLS